jgi:hypothetical protein
MPRFTGLSAQKQKAPVSRGLLLLHSNYVEWLRYFFFFAAAFFLAGAFFLAAAFFLVANFIE